MTDRPLVVHITGARPNFPKAAPGIAALAPLWDGQAGPRIAAVLARHLGAG